jgi:hypothetical protein
LNDAKPSVVPRRLIHVRCNKGDEKQPGPTLEGSTELVIVRLVLRHKYS